MNDTPLLAVTIKFSAFLRKVPGLVKDGKLKPIPVKKFGGGLGKVYSDGYNYLTEGKVSAERVVFTVRGYASSLGFVLQIVHVVNTRINFRSV